MKVDYDEFIRRYTKNKHVEIEEDIAVFIVNFTYSLVPASFFYMGGTNLWSCIGVFLGMFIIQNRISAIRK